MEAFTCSGEWSGLEGEETEKKTATNGDDDEEENEEEECGTQDFYYFYNRVLHGVRRGPWKLRTFEGTELFNLDLDVSERYNRAEEHPEIVAELSALMDAMRTGPRAPDRGGHGSMSPATACPRNRTRSRSVVGILANS